jgi:hypothetical protein
VYVYGIQAWGRGAPLNYLLAKLAWDPQADVEGLFDEFCQKAYAEGGDHMNRMFRLMDAEVERHFLEYPGARYGLTTDMMRDVYAKNLGQVERLYRAAESKVQDPDAKARLEMIGDNLTVLCWNLRQHRLLDSPEESSFYLSDADFFQFLSGRRGSLALQPTATTGKPGYVGKKLSVAPARNIPRADPVKPFRLRGNQHLVLCPTGEKPVEVKFSRITTRGKLVTYSVYRPDGTELAAGLVSGTVPIELAAKGSDYYHLAISAGTASYMVEVAGAAWAVDGRLGDQGLHFLGTEGPVYFSVPDGTAAFHISLEATPPGETAEATLFKPGGEKVAEFNCTEVSVDRKELSVPREGAGWWKIEVRRASTGALDDVWVKPGDELSGYFSLVPGEALGVERGE